MQGTLQLFRSQRQIDAAQADIDVLSIGTEPSDRESRQGLVRATGAGAEVQWSPVTGVIGGILSSAALTLLVLPVLYRLAHRRENEEIVEGVPATPCGGAFKELVHPAPRLQAATAPASRPPRPRPSR